MTSYNNSSLVYEHDMSSSNPISSALIGSSFAIAVSLSTPNIAIPQSPSLTVNSIPVTSESINKKNVSIYVDVEEPMVAPYSKTITVKPKSNNIHQKVSSELPTVPAYDTLS